MEAAHIKPYSVCEEKEKSDPRNGILLRADMHTLFDLGLIIIQPDYRVNLKYFLSESPYTLFKSINNQILRSVKNEIFNPGVKYLEWRLKNYEQHIGKHLRDDIKTTGLFDEILIAASQAITILNQSRES